MLVSWDGPAGLSVEACLAGLYRFPASVRIYEARGAGGAISVGARRHARRTRGPSLFKLSPRVSILYGENRPRPGEAPRASIWRR